MSEKEKYRDCIFLSCVVLFSFILNIHGLGFYGSDWSFLGNLTMSEDQSLPGLFQAIYGDWVLTQPGKILYLSFLYWLFGLNPLGYHFFNTIIFLLNIVLFYLILRHLKQNRLLSVSVALVYALLPHYSTVRFWVQGFVPNLSMSFYFLSTYSELQSVQARPPALWRWKLISSIGIICSTLTYDITIPFFLINLILVRYREWRLSIEEEFDNESEEGPFLSEHPKQPIRTNSTFLSYVTLFVLLPIIIFKISAAIWLGNSKSITLVQDLFNIYFQMFNPDFGNYDWGLNYVHAFVVAFGEYGLGLPVILWNIIQKYPDVLNFAAGGLLGIAIFLYFWHVMKQSDYGHSEQRRMAKFVKRGLIVFALGYTLFITSWNVQFTTTGAGNITTIAAAVGVALTLVGVVGWVSTLFQSDRLRQSFYCTLVTLLCTSGFLINNTVASFWISAYDYEKQIVEYIHGKFPSLPPESTLILDGICPYVGPAVLFESNWDLTGALMILYRDYSIRADIVTPKLSIKDEGIYVSSYGVVQEYPYKNLFIENLEQKVSFNLTDSQSAQDYFQKYNPTHNLSCPNGRPGFGLPIFRFKTFVFR